VTQLVLLALEHFILSVQSAIPQLLLWLMEMNAEEHAQLDNIGDPQIIHANPACLLVLTVSELELMIATLVLMDFT
jgi:hypothetical protein